ncbi:MAG: Gfo/Idh/MocA family oxidoreductase [Planctomycetaceae bacterium]|nr:Gfo/Idh/MocA family oxidoreductase [Planctomycetaceae bacterium]
MIRMSRREMLKHAAAGAAGAMAVPYLVPASALAADDKPGANERIRVGAIGVGGRASLLLDQLPEAAEIVALCDCNLPRAEAYRAKHKAKWPVIQDYRKLLERKDIDAVIVGTGEFQRVLPCIHALQAGKDIYAEKPLTLYIGEGRVLADAVKRHNRVFQVGTQQRSMTLNRIACELIRTGGLGQIKEVRAVNYPGPKDSPAQPFPKEPVPAGFDWDVWLNQAAWREYNHGWGYQGWMQWRDFSGGEVTNWGAHGIDQIQWALGTDDTGPVEMFPLPTPSGAVEMRYASGIPVRFVQAKAPMGGAIFIGENGKLEINRNKFASNPKDIAVELLKKVNEAEEEKKWADSTALWQAKWHLQNWLDCIRSREQPVATAEIGHRSVTVCHLLNITRQLGRKLQWDPVKEQFVGDDEANRYVNRPRRKGYELPDPA